MTKLKSWQDVAGALINVAAGRAKADMVVKNGRWVNVHSGEIIPATDIAISQGRFAYVGHNADAMTGKSNRTPDI